MPGCGCSGGTDLTCEEIQACVGCPVTGSPTVAISGGCAASVIISADDPNSLDVGTDGGLYVPPFPAPGDFTCTSLEACSIDSLGDVSIEDPVEGDALVFDGTNWSGFNIASLTEHPYRHRTRSTDVGIPHNDATLIQWSDDVTNIIDGAEIQYAAGVFTVNRTGRYQISAGVAWAPAAGGRAEIRLFIDGSHRATGTIPGSTQDFTTTQVHMTAHLVDLQEIELQAFQTSGADRAIRGSTARDWVTIAFIGD